MLSILPQNELGLKFFVRFLEELKKPKRHFKINRPLAMFCLYTLPLARPAQVKIQMITTSSWTVKILLHINNFNYTWHMQNNLVKSNCPTSRNIQLLYENFLIIFIGLIGMLNWKKKVIWLAVLFKTFMKRFHLHPIWVILTFWLFWSFKLEERYCTH